LPMRTFHFDRGFFYHNKSFSIPSQRFKVHKATHSRHSMAHFRQFILGQDGTWQMPLRNLTLLGQPATPP
jgi:hypothetical protein